MLDSDRQSVSLSLSVVSIDGGLSGMEIEGTYSETMFCRKRLAQHRLKPLKGSKRFIKDWIWLVSIWVLGLMVIGCSNDGTLTLPTRHTVEISGLNLTTQMLGPGDTATVIATFDYSGDAANLIFRWEASSGQIVGDASSAIYIAPDKIGTYTLRLRLTDGFAAAEHTITVEVVDLHSLLIDSDTYWAGEGETFVLKYRVSVRRILQQPMILRYDILQDKAKTGAFLSVEVDGTLLIEEKAIGKAQAAGMIVITGTIDVSKIIAGPGIYDVILTLVAVNPTERGWLLQKAELIGAEGSAVRL